MKSIRLVRMVVAGIFFLAAIAYFLTANIPDDTVAAVRAHDSLAFVENAQLIPSSIALCMGALLFWLCATFFIGRIYCSTVCPVGTLSDIFMRLHRELGKLFPGRPMQTGPTWRTRIFGRLQFRWKNPNRWRYHIMAVYFICLVIGIMAIPFLMEPWNILRNTASLGEEEIVASTWIRLGVGMLLGVGLSGIITLGVVAVWGFGAGRDFCNVICPIGQAMGIIDRFTLLHVEFDPDRCISCMRCEEVCRSSCISVKNRLVDNSRCVKCFDCICKCPNGAIRLQPNRNRAATPLMERT